jgi:hypothetical protein
MRRNADIKRGVSDRTEAGEPLAMSAIASSVNVIVVIDSRDV